MDQPPGREALGEVDPITFTTHPGCQSDTPLLGPSGLCGQLREASLLGPVTLQRVSRPAAPGAATGPGE